MSEFNSFNNEQETTEFICDKCCEKVNVSDAIVSWKFAVDRNQIPQIKIPVGIVKKHLRKKPFGITFEKVE